MKNTKQGNLAVQLSILFGSIVLILVATFVYYMFIKPEKLEINQVSYTRIDNSEYDVNEDELNHGLFLTNNFDVDNSTVQMHKDLKDLYSGRNNPFAKFPDNREDIEIIEELNRLAEEKKDQTNQFDEEIIY